MKNNIFLLLVKEDFLRAGRTGELSHSLVQLKMDLETISTSTDSERVFSAACRFCTKNRSCQSPSSSDNFSFGHSFFKREHSGINKLLPTLFAKYFSFFLVFFLNNVESCLKNKHYHVSKKYYLFILISKSHLNLLFTSKLFIKKSLKLSKYNSTLQAILCLYYSIFILSFLMMEV